MIRDLTKNHLFLSAFYKAASGFSLLLSIPILIKYLGSTDYGLWILIFTLFQIILLMDFGLASALKTKIPQLLSLNDKSTIVAYIRLTYIVTLIIGALIFLLFFALINMLDLKLLLKISNHDNVFIKGLFLINIFFFCLNFVLNTQKSLFVSVFKGKFAEESIAVTQFVCLLCFAVVIAFFPENNKETALYVITFINGAVSVGINLLYTLRFFNMEKLSLTQHSKVSKGFVSEILRMGFKFMLIQLGTIFIFSVDPYILAYYFGPDEIVIYEVVNKYFLFPLMILTAGFSPLWSLFAKHYFDKDFEWLVNTFRKFNYAFIGLCILMCLFTALAPILIPMWIKTNVHIPNLLLVAFSALTSIRIFTTFYSYFLSGTGNLKSYMILLLISVIIKVPLSILFINMGFEVTGVLVSSIACTLLLAVIQPIVAYKDIRDLRND